MGYITSRKDGLPRSARGMSNQTWYNMWSTKRWPYGELLRGDLLYWYEPPSKRIIWRTHIKKLERFRYSNKAAARRRIERKLGAVDPNERYYQERQEKGYCVAFKVGQVRKVRLSKPGGVRFDPLGWKRVTESIAKKWLRAW
ncbi:MAG: hypothetical protein ACE5IP_11195 [Terriglobia bacterium]